MKTFLHVNDLGPLDKALAEAAEIKNNRYKFEHLGHHKTALLIFFNNSLRTRLSTQKAARNLGIDVMVLDVNQGAWKLETERGVVMDGDKSEHLLEAIPVMAQFCDVIGVRTFAGLTDRDADYAENVLSQFIKYSGRPVFSMESATAHPLQAFADLITIEEHRLQGKRPKVVLTWAPHPRALPQAVPNSFAEWMTAWNKTEFVIANPEGYNLSEEFTKGATILHNQEEALQDADFIYVKNWSSYEDYGTLRGTHSNWMLDNKKIALTNNAKVMHCLPVRRNVELSDKILDGPNSIVVQEAGNRVWAAQAVISELLQAAN